ncbi:MAG TPA: hypothetical protein VF746_23145 [Longimicrobium sp.]|jgi:hypothetical protein
MQKTFVRAMPAALALALALALLALAGAAAAQEPPDTTPGARRASIHLLPSLGSSGFTVLGQHAQGNYATLTRAPVLGLAAELRTPVRFIDLRGSVLHSRPVLRPDDEDFTTRSRTSVTLLTLDAVVRAPRVLDVRPYLVAGGGVKHYDFDQEELGAAGDDPFARDYTAPVFHLGAGLEWDVGRYGLYVESGIYTGEFKLESTRFTSYGQTEWPLTFGLRIPIR